MTTRLSGFERIEPRLLLSTTPNEIDPLTLDGLEFQNPIEALWQINAINAANSSLGSVVGTTTESTPRTFQHSVPNEWIIRDGGELTPFDPGSLSANNLESFFRGRNDLTTLSVETERAVLASIGVPMELNLQGFVNPDSALLQTDVLASNQPDLGLSAISVVNIGSALNSRSSEIAPQVLQIVDLRQDLGVNEEFYLASFDSGSDMLLYARGDAGQQRSYSDFEVVAYSALATFQLDARIGPDLEVPKQKNEQESSWRNHRNDSTFIANPAKPNRNSVDETIELIVSGSTIDIGQFADYPSIQAIPDAMSPRLRTGTISVIAESRSTLKIRHDASRNLSTSEPEETDVLYVRPQVIDVSFSGNTLHNDQSTNNQVGSNSNANPYQHAVRRFNTHTAATNHHVSHRRTTTVTSVPTERTIDLDVQTILSMLESTSIDSGLRNVSPPLDLTEEHEPFEEVIASQQLFGPLKVDKARPIDDQEPDVVSINPRLLHPIIAIAAPFLLHRRYWKRVASDETTNRDMQIRQVSTGRKKK